MACDICGKTGTSLIDLLSIYETPEIKQICPKCESDVNTHLGKLKRMTNKMNRSWLKRFMLIRKEKSVT